MVSPHSRSATKIALAAFVGLLCASTAVWAQFPDTLGLKGNGKPAKAVVQFDVALVPTGDKAVVALEIAAKIPPKHYIYSMSRSNGAETRVTLSQVQGLEAVDQNFTADHAPKIDSDEDIDGKEIKVEKFYNAVTWTRRYRLKAGTARKDVAIVGSIKFQLCNEQTCQLPPPHPFNVALAETPKADSIEQVAAVEEPAAVEPDEASAPPAPAELEPNGKTEFQQLVGLKDNKTLAATWRVSVQPRTARPGDVVTVTVEADLQDTWHVYALDQRQNEEGGPLATRINLESSQTLLSATSEFEGAKAIEKESEGWTGLVERFYEGHVIWTRKYTIPPETQAGNVDLKGAVAYMICNKGGCQPPTGFRFHGALVVADVAEPEVAALTIDEKLTSGQAAEFIEEREVAVADTAVAAPKSGPEAATSIAAAGAGIDKSQGLPLFLLTAVIAGFAALLTPCVFPMIPITVSFFLKQSEREHHKPFTMAAVYCFGIIATFTGLGLLISILFRAAALNGLANNAWLNLIIAGVLVFFGFNLLGLFEIRIPSWLLTYTSGQESRGGYVGVLFMALTFTLTSFTCTFAFAGGLIAAAAKGDRLWPLLGLLAFSTAFSLPFFFLALFPSFLQKLPKSGGWMNCVKVVMGFLELGAAFKFLSTADLAWHPEPWIFDYQFVMVGWMVISISTGLYLLGLFRLSHDTPADHIGTFRLVFAMSFLGLAGYLTVGLLATEKPKGQLWAYIDAFATPKFDGGRDPDGPFLKHGGLKYALDFERALEFAVKSHQPVFLDFTGVNCVNCRWMEKGPMASPEVEAKLSHFVRVQLFTDNVPTVPSDEAKRLVEYNRKLQEDWFGDVSLPSYVVIPPDPAILKSRDKILATFVGKEQRSGEFSSFLDDALKSWNTLQAAGPKSQLVGRR